MLSSLIIAESRQSDKLPDDSPVLQEFKRDSGLRAGGRRILPDVSVTPAKNTHGEVIPLL